MKTVKICCFILLFFIFSPVSTWADPISGIRITQTGGMGLTVDIDVTAFYALSGTETSAYLGTSYGIVPALSWGDGSTVPPYGYGSSTGIPLVAASTVVNGVPARAYRGSFSHTYGAPGTFTISANTTGTSSASTIATGNLVVTTIFTSTLLGTTSFVTTFVNNTLPVTVPEIAIPSLSQTAIVALFLLLSLIGLFTLNRSYLGRLTK